MTTRKLEKSEWSAFFNDVSKGLKDAQAEIEIASLKLGDQIEATWLPLYGVVYDPKDDIFEIALKGLDHLIQKPREVYLEEEAGKLVNVEIVDAENNHQIVRFREPHAAQFLIERRARRSGIDLKQLPDAVGRRRAEWSA